MRLGKQIRRVDVQVSILMIIVTIFCSSCIYLVCYRMTHRDMINSLEERVFAIYDFLEDSLDKTMFEEINTREDMEKKSYREMKRLLRQVKSATNMMYLYTAKKNEEGQFVYVIDGLEARAEDFRYPGDLIEPEIVPDMQRALDGERVLPKNIKDTEWGKIFITYFPVHDGEKVVGVLGIEIGAEHQYNTYQSILRVLPGIVLFVSLLSTAVAVVAFRRISNPTYQDLYNTDQLTQLENRNAFQTDLSNMEAEGIRAGVGMISIDLNDLKLVNDRFGHYMGDRYIESAARAIRAVVGKRGAAYRTGGDEYVILFNGASEVELEEILDGICRYFAQRAPEVGADVLLSLSGGVAVYDKARDRGLAALYERADASMYESKRLYHTEREKRRSG